MIDSEHRLIYRHYNCERVYVYLKNNGVIDDNLLYPCGPIDDIHFRTKSLTSVLCENIIIYHPKKGIEFTQQIIHNIQFSQDCLLSLFQFREWILMILSHFWVNLKYILDFGYFPGSERIPREAVMMYCNIITSKTGCAENDVDVPIPDIFKFDVKPENIPIILENLRYPLDNYEMLVPNYDLYREIIMSQKPLFVQGADKLINYFNSQQ